MTGQWQKTAVRELCDITSSKRIYAADYRSEGVPFYRGKEIIEKQRGGRQVSTELFISWAKFLEIRNRFGVPLPGDLLLTSVGTLGVPYVVRDGEVFYFKDGNLTWFRNFRNLDSQFLYYWLLSPAGKAELKKCTIGSSQPALTIILLKEMEIELPPLPIQRRIAGILSAYDDLIENNTRRIQILEEMAQTIYREWFVNFRFPGHGKVKMVDSTIGPIPEGWEARPVGDILCFHIGGGWGQDQSSQDYPMPAHVIRGTDIPRLRYGDASTCPLRYHKSSNLKSRRLRVGDIVMEVSGGSKGQPVGRSLMIDEGVLRALPGDIICASFCKLLRVDEGCISPELLYMHMQELYATGGIEQYQVQSTGITNLKFEHFLAHEMVAIPPCGLQLAFANIAKPVLSSIQLHGLRNGILRNSRDLLLPKLISGDMDISELDISIRGAVGGET